MIGRSVSKRYLIIKKCKKKFIIDRKINIVNRDKYYATLALELKEYMKDNNFSRKECAKNLGISSAIINQILQEKFI